MNTIKTSVRLAAVWTLTLILAPVPSGAQEDNFITVVSWGGSYARSSVKAYHERFVEETGIQIKLDEYNGGLAQVRAQAETGNVTWDVIDMEAGDTLLGCDEGLLETIDYETLPAAPDGTPATEDFLDAFDVDCGAKGLIYSTVYAYNDTLFPDLKPATMADFFDLGKFPGRRGMRRTPNANLEFALVADGVPADQVYEVLSSEGGIARAFRKLDTIKDQVVWWEAGAQPPQMLADREVVMSTAFNGRIFNAWALEKQPLTIVWDGQLLAFGYQVIVAGTPKLDLARQFVAFATSTVSLANITKYISYGPLRRSSLALVDKHLETGIDMEPHLPNAPQNMSNAVREDPEWWADNQDEMNERFAAWLIR
ncbi:MAG: ABC transporter substrate-binding protein [Gammaproteobacteria bacterium]|nr:ABC transporter substrate-binding protein [Gammaproteobacteria bacterium]